MVSDRDMKFFLLCFAVFWLFVGALGGGLITYLARWTVQHVLIR